MPFKTIGGYIQANGTIKSGTGFTVDHTSGSAVYFINFNPPFVELPAVSVTQVFPEDMNSGGGDPTDNAVIIAISEQKVKILTGTSNGKYDRSFSFIVYGNSEDN